MAVTHCATFKKIYSNNLTVGSVGYYTFSLGDMLLGGTAFTTAESTTTARSITYKCLFKLNSTTVPAYNSTASWEADFIYRPPSMTLLTGSSPLPKMTYTGVISYITASSVSAVPYFRVYINATSTYTYAMYVDAFVTNIT